jgi:CRP-like cAMP-binding protein
MAYAHIRRVGFEQNSLPSEASHPVSARREVIDILQPEWQTQLPVPPGASPGNRLLNAVPTAEYALLRPHLARIALSQGEVLYRAEEQLAHVYFPTDALIALVGVTAAGGTLETGLVGDEGMAGLPVFWGTLSAPYMSVIRQAGEALRMRADVFRRKANDAVRLRELLLFYTNLSFNYAAQTAVCNRLHVLEKRMATWLLTTRDRLGRNDFDFTHDLIASSLGVRRSGVSVEMEKFAGAGWLRLRRAQIRIVDGKGLQTAACECYGVIKAEFEQYLRSCTNSALPGLYASQAV